MLIRNKNHLSWSIPQNSPVNLTRPPWHVCIKRHFLHWWLRLPGLPKPRSWGLSVWHLLCLEVPGAAVGWSACAPARWACSSDPLGSIKFMLPLFSCPTLHTAPVSKAALPTSSLTPAACPMLKCHVAVLHSELWAWDSNSHLGNSQHYRVESCQWGELILMHATHGHQSPLRCLKVNENMHFCAKKWTLNCNTFIHIYCKQACRTLRGHSTFWSIHEFYRWLTLMKFTVYRLSKDMTE